MLVSATSPSNAAALTNAVQQGEPRRLRGGTNPAHAGPAIPSPVTTLNMVSFFGLRFGSDRKKLQYVTPRRFHQPPLPFLSPPADRRRSKQQEAEKSAKIWRRDRNGSTGSGQSFGHVLPRPQRPPSRPGTSSSHRTTLFRSPFSNVEATASMVDLAPPGPRKSSAGSLRQAASSSNLRASRPVISGPISPPVPLPLPTDQASPASLARTATGGSSKKDWVNPLDVHFGKDMASAPRPRTASGPSPAARSPLGRLEFDTDDTRSRKGSTASVRTKPDTGEGPDGYPSPPTSVKSVEQGISRASTEPKASQLAKPTPSSLRRVNTADPVGLPSPTISEERPDSPVVRNVQAKRDTMTFHSPRRRSFTKNVQETAPKRQTRGKSEQEKLEIKKRRQTEGFEGNFSAFNFGRRAVDPSSPLSTDYPALPMSASDSLADIKRTSPSMLEKTSTLDRGMDGPATETDAAVKDGQQPEHEAHEASDADSMTVPSLQESFPQEPSSNYTRAGRDVTGTPSLDSLEKRVRPRVDSDTRCPGTPTALRAPPPVTEWTRRSSGSQSQRTHSFDELDEAPPPKLNPDRRSQSPLRSKQPIEGSFPVTKGLPRGRRPDSVTAPRGRSPATLDDVPPPRLNPDRRSQSPLTTRRPMEGIFPVSKGLPRGRRPGPMPAPISPVPYGGGAAPPRPPREKEGLTSTPGWADRSDKHMSALPAPLSPFSTNMTTSSNDGGGDTASTPTSLVPPRLPSPTFTSLEESMTENLAKAFEEASFSESTHDVSKPLISPVLSEFGGRNGGNSPLRVESKRAPPRPPPITLPPSTSATPEGSVKSPTNTELSSGFI